jgi:hypothetical protein
LLHFADAVPGLAAKTGAATRTQRRRPIMIRLGVVAATVALSAAGSGSPVVLTAVSTPAPTFTIIGIDDCPPGSGAGWVFMGAGCAKTVPSNGYGNGNSTGNTGADLNCLPPHSGACTGGSISNHDSH